MARDLGLAGLSAVLLILGFPNFGLSALAWVALVPLLVALEGKSLTQSYLLSYFVGVVFYSGIFYWIWNVDSYNLLDYALIQIVYSPQYVSLWGLALTSIRKRTRLPASLVAPSLWVALEYARSHAGFLSFPWALLGQSQYLHPALIQITSVTGVYGLSFLIVLVNVAIAETVLRARDRLLQTAPASASWRVPLASVTASVLLLVAILSYGFAILPEKPTSPRMKVALVQANIPNQQKSDGTLRQKLLEKQAKLTREIANAAPELIVWSETAVSGDVQHTPELRKQVAQLAVDVNSYLLVGSAEHAKFTNRDLRGKFYNSMVLFTPEGSVAGEYRKIQLVPFGEYVPLRRYISWPKAIAPEMGDLLAGDQHTLFDIRGVKFATTICWELIFPELFSEFVKKGAAFMTIATNEAWFGETGAPYELLAMSAFRAVENRVAIARAANTGVSAFIDPFGRITQRVRGADKKDLFVEGALVGDVAISRERTFYTRYGDVFAFSQIGVCALTLAYALLKALS